MKIEIKEPCDANWDQMKIGLISRHCEACQKDVMDFTQKSRAEIILYLLSKRDQNVCGRMNASQFDFHHDDIPILIEAFKTNKTSTNTSFLILTLVCLSLASCSLDNSNIKSKIEPPKESKIAKDSLENFKLGEVVPTKKSDVKNSKKVKCSNVSTDEKLMGEPTIEGELSIIDPPIIETSGLVSMDFDVENPTIKPLKFAEKMPEFKGGVPALMAFMKDKMIYPLAEKEEGVEGTVYVKIIVNVDGTISNPSIIRGISGHPSFEKEALRVIGLMPLWIPGENGGKQVAVEYNLPFKFKLN
jgi:TonB family protein